MDTLERKPYRNGHTNIQLTHVVPDEIPMFEPNRKIILIFNNPLPKNVTMNVCFMGLRTRKVFNFTPRTLNEYTLEVRDIEHTTAEDTKLSVRVGPDNKELCTYRRPFIFLSRLSLVTKLIQDESDPIDFLCTSFKLEHKTISKLDTELKRRFCINMPDDYRLLRDVDCNGNVGQDLEQQHTLLHFAAQYNFIELIRSLLECPGAIRLLQCENHFGSTPIELAKECGHSNLAKFLETVFNKGSENSLKRIESEGSQHNDGESIYEKVRKNKIDMQVKNDDESGYMVMNKNGLNLVPHYVNMNTGNKSQKSKNPSTENVDVPGRTSPKFGTIDNEISDYDYPPSPEQANRPSFGVIDDRYSGYDIPPSSRPRINSSTSSTDRINFSGYRSQSSVDSPTDENAADVFSKSSGPNSGFRNFLLKDRLKEITDKQRPPAIPCRRQSTCIELSPEFPEEPPSRVGPKLLPRSQVSLDIPDKPAGRTSPRDSGPKTPEGGPSLPRQRSLSDAQPSMSPPPCPTVDYPRQSKRRLSRTRGTFPEKNPIDFATYDEMESIYTNTGKETEEPTAYDIVAPRNQQQEEPTTYDIVAPRNQQEDTMYDVVKREKPIPRRRSAQEVSYRPPVKPPPLRKTIPIPAVPRRQSSPLLNP